MSDIPKEIANDSKVSLTADGAIAFATMLLRRSLDGDTDDARIFLPVLQAMVGVTPEREAQLYGVLRAMFQIAKESRQS
jgi:hypothetical protein